MSRFRPDLSGGGVKSNPIADAAMGRTTRRPITVTLERNYVTAATDHAAACVED